jgi:Uma2 family endonuclease
MSATATGYMEVIEQSLDALPPGSSIVINGLAWDEYEDLVEEMDGIADIKLMYDDGRLEALTLSPEREEPKSLFVSLLGVLAEETNTPLRCFGSSTLKKKGKRKGADPDECFYIGHAAEMKGKKRLNLKTDPPPDLVIEVDVTSSSLDKFAIYAGIGVPEFWRYQKDKLHFHRLTSNQYTEIAVSDHFPFLTPAIVTDYLRLGEEEDVTAMNRAFREWVRTARKKGRK